MSTVSPQLALGLCILGACVAAVTGYALSHLLRKTVLSEHEESSEMTNSFRHISREQRDYMVEVRRRNGDDGWERLRVELKKEKEKQSAMMQIRGGGGGSRVIGSRYDYTGGVYDEVYPSDSGSGSGSGSGGRRGNGCADAGGYYEDEAPTFEV